MAPIAALLLAAALAPSAAAAFDLEGHRGARGLAPENTLPAFAEALAIGVTTLELDTAITRDGVVVVSHDPALNPDITRGPDGKWLAKRGPAIHDLTYEELSRYDVGRMKPDTSYARRYPEQVPVDGTRIPRLADVFALVERSGNRSVRFNIEIKTSPLAPGETLAPERFARKLVDAIRQSGMATRAMIESFDWRALQVVQREAPEIPTVYLTARQRFLDNVCTGTHAGSPRVEPSDCGASPWTAGFQLREAGGVPKMVKAAGGRIWSPYVGDVDAAKIGEAHALGLEVVVWTPDDAASIGRMLDLGVDGLITDRPDIAREVMRRRGMPLAPRTQPKT